MDEETIRRAVDVALKTLCGKSPVLIMEAQGGRGGIIQKYTTLVCKTFPRIRSVGLAM